MAITDLKKHISNKAKVECKSEKDLDDLHKLNQKEDKEITKNLMKMKSDYEKLKSRLENFTEKFCKRRRSRSRSRNAETKKK